MARAHFVKKALKDNPVAKKGESYYWWKFRFGGKHYSKTPPKASQLTSSEFLSSMYELEERISELSADSLEDLQSEVQSIIDDLRQLGEEQEEKLSNMPDGLQEGEVGQMLQERADECENMASELEGLDFDEPEADEPEREEGESDEDFKERQDEAAEEHEQAIADHLEEVLNEARGVSYQGS